MLDRRKRGGVRRAGARPTVRNRLAAGPVVALAVALAAGCGADDPGSAAGPGTGGRLDPTVLDGTATTLDGAPFDLGALAGKDLVVWFWAPW